MIIKADKNRIESMINYINEKAQESERLCSLINTTYDTVPWDGKDRNFVNNTADRMKLQDMRNAMEDFKAYSNKLRDWLSCIEMHQGMMKNLIGKLEVNTLIFVFS